MPMKTERGKRLAKLRARVVASGVPLLDLAEINKEGNEGSEETTTMTKPTTAAMQTEIDYLKKEIELFKRDLDAVRADRSKTEDALCETRRRNRELMEVVREERKEVLFFRKRMREANKAVRTLRERITFAVDITGGRPDGTCRPMGRVLEVTVGSILVHGLDTAANQIQCDTNVENMEAHKFIRNASEVGLPPLEALDMDAKS